MNLPILENFDDKNKKKKDPTFEAHEYNKKLMGASGLFALAGMGLSVAKARKKIKDKWNREKVMALREGRPVPPMPDLSKGAILAMLKGAATGAAAGWVAGKFVPGLNEVGASVHGAANKALTGSALKTGRHSKAFFSDTLIDDEMIQISQEFFSDIYSMGYNMDDFLEYEHFSKKSKSKKNNDDEKKEKKSFEKEMWEKVKKKGQKFLDKNPYNKADAEAMAAQNPAKRSFFDPKANYLIPTLTAAGGGLTSTIMAYRKAIEEWKGQYDAAIENNEVPPEKPELSEFLGAGMKGAITGGISGAILNKALMGTDKGKEILNKAENVANQVGVITNRRKANKYIKHQGEHTLVDKARRANEAFNEAKENVEHSIESGKKAAKNTVKFVSKSAKAVKFAFDITSKAFKDFYDDFMTLKKIKEEEELDNFRRNIKKIPGLEQALIDFGVDVNSDDLKYLKKKMKEFKKYYKSKTKNFSHSIYENSYLSGFNYIMSGNYNDSIGLENTDFSGTTVVAPAAPENEGESESFSYNFSDIDVANTHFTFQEYKDTLACYGMETTLTEEQFNFSYNDEELKINLIKNMMLKDL